MRRILKRRPSPSMIVAMAALVVAVAGTAIAGPLGSVSVLNKKEKKQTRNISKTEINKAAPGLSVAKAVTATNADRATEANNATTVGGIAPTGLGRGLVFGGMGATPPGAFQRPPFGPSNTCASVIPCANGLAPIALTFREFRAAPAEAVDAGDSLQISLSIIGGPTTALCTVSSATCTAAGPISIPAGAEFFLQNNGVALEGDEEWSFAYRLTPP